MTKTARSRAETTFQPVRNDRTFEIVVQRVREKLLSGELKPGHKLPPERELARQLDVSRNVVREALRSLENAGLVRTRKGARGGAFIEEGSPTQIAQALKDLVTLNAITLGDLFEARIMMLEMVLDRIGTRIASLDFGELEANLIETREAVEDSDSARRVSVARDFYHAIAALTGNTALVFTIDAQTELVQTFLRYRVSDMDSDRLLQSRAAFLDLLRAGRIEEANAELRAHLQRVHESLW
jgi:DNA-binding FadR family transcriptional regulator